VERRLTHPCVLAISAAAKAGLQGMGGGSVASSGESMDGLTG
jgi:LysR family transcriptional regulator, transcriptional activator of nhaA